jgi:hypothetical protein
MNTEIQNQNDKELNEAALQNVSAGIIPFVVAGLAGLIGVGAYLVKDMENPYPGKHVR